jgi:hypothetical protein
MPEDNLIAERLKNATSLETLQHYAMIQLLITGRAPDDTPASQLRPPLDEPNWMEWSTKKLHELTSAGHAIRGQESYETMLRHQKVAREVKDSLGKLLALSAPSALAEEAPVDRQTPVALNDEWPSSHQSELDEYCQTAFATPFSLDPDVEKELTEAARYRADENAEWEAMSQEDKQADISKRLSDVLAELLQYAQMPSGRGFILCSLLAPSQSLGEEQKRISREFEAVFGCLRFGKPVDLDGFVPLLVKLARGDGIADGQQQPQLQRPAVELIEALSDDAAFVQILKQVDGGEELLPPCSVCQEPLDASIREDGEEAIVRTECDHRFHLKCIGKWVTRLVTSGQTPPCPCCRTDVFKVSLASTGAVKQLVTDALQGSLQAIPIDVDMDAEIEELRMRNGWSGGESVRPRREDGSVDQRSIGERRAQRRHLRERDQRRGANANAGAGDAGTAGDEAEGVEGEEGGAGAPNADAGGAGSSSDPTSPAASPDNARGEADGAGDDAMEEEDPQQQGGEPEAAAANGGAGSSAEGGGEQEEEVTAAGDDANDDEILSAAEDEDEAETPGGGTSSEGTSLGIMAGKKKGKRPRRVIPEGSSSEEEEAAVGGGGEAGDQPGAEPPPSTGEAAGSGEHEQDEMDDGGGAAGGGGGEGGEGDDEQEPRVQEPRVQEPGGSGGGGDPAAPASGSGNDERSAGGEASSAAQDGGSGAADVPAAPAVAPALPADSEAVLRAVQQTDFGWSDERKGLWVASLVKAFNKAHPEKRVQHSPGQPLPEGLSVFMAPAGLMGERAALLVLVNLLTRVRLVGREDAAIVPFEFNRKKYCAVYGKEAVLQTRRHLGGCLTTAIVAKLRAKPNPNQPDFELMQDLYDAGIGRCPLSGTPIFDPSSCSDELKAVLWRVYCGVATCVNTKELGQKILEDLDELKRRLREHADLPGLPDAPAAVPAAPPPPPPLPGGYKVGQTCFLARAGFTSGNNTWTYGQQGEVMGVNEEGGLRMRFLGNDCVVGPATLEGYVGKGLRMRFLGNDCVIGFSLEELSTTAPPPLPGGYKLGQKLFYIGDNYTLDNGDRLTHGQQGKVVGPATDEEYVGKGLAMRFLGNKDDVECLLTELSTAPPGSAPASASSPLASRLNDLERQEAAAAPAGRAARLL